MQFFCFCVSVFYFRASVFPFPSINFLYLTVSLRISN